MTVKQLIEELNKIENKDLLVAKFIPGSSDGPDSLLILTEINDGYYCVYNHKSKKLNEYIEVECITFNFGKFL